MKSMAYVSVSMRSICLLCSNSLVLMRGHAQCHTGALCRHTGSKTDFLCISTTKHRCINSVRSFRCTRERGAVALQFDNIPAPEEKDCEDLVHQLERYLLPTKVVRVTSTDSQCKTAVIPKKIETDSMHFTQQYESEMVRDLCSRVSHANATTSVAGLASLLGLCVDLGMDSQNPILCKLKEECMDKLSKENVSVSQLCLLGEAAYNIDGRSKLLSQVLNNLRVTADTDLDPAELCQVYSLLAHVGVPKQCRTLLSSLHWQAERMVLSLDASAVSEILHALAVLKQHKVTSLVRKLTRQASKFMQHFSDLDLIRLLKALMCLGQTHEELLASMEKHLPKRVLTADPELSSILMEYCLHIRCRSQPVLEAVAESFILNAESYSTPQITRQIVVMGRLNYLPDCASLMFKTLESILYSRFTQFKPRALLDVLHSCIHLERFPLNFVAKVFSPYFLHKLEAQEDCSLDRSALAQLTQLNMSTTLECVNYQGPRLPYHYHVTRPSSVDKSFEIPMDTFLYKQVKGPLCLLLGGKNLFSTRVFTRNLYTIDMEICLNEEGLVLPITQWDLTDRRIALCLDGQDRFCSNTHHLLGKEVTKRRHLKQLGYEVVQIPHFEYDKLKTQEEQMDYLRMKIYPTISRLYQ